MKRLLAIILSGCLSVALAAEARSDNAPRRTVLANGLVLLSSEQKALPMVSIELLIHAGSRYDPAAHEGIANLTAELLTYGTERRTALEISEFLDFIGARLSVDCGEDLATVSMTILKKDLANGLELLAEILTAAAFPQDEIERRKQSIIASIKAREEDPGAIAALRFQSALYPDSPFGRPVEGSEASVQAIPRERVIEFYRAHYRPNRAIMAVVGAIT
ncbi:MAG TPA: pitrilysin family protein, partial [Candidatus Eisenbacteria bacterium]|nr:pitrilysin family protein [Candidatus Eisenbacteria bacterium]